MGNKDNDAFLIYAIGTFVISADGTFVLFPVAASNIRGDSSVALMEKVVLRHGETMTIVPDDGEGRRIQIKLLVDKPLGDPIKVWDGK